MAERALFLGVDGGGSGTQLCLLDQGGGVRATASAPSPYAPADAPALARRVLTEAVARVCAAAGASPDDVALALVGLPGYGEASGEVPALRAAVRGALGHDRCEVVNDMVCGWAGSLGGDDGINVVAGTGSLAYGERAGRSARAGGWGELFGDEGSAYWIAVEGLRAASRMADGRAPAGPLLGALREHLGLATDLDLVGVVLGEWAGDRARVAALAPVVTAAAGSDPAARAVVAAAARELAGLVVAVRAALGHAPGEPVAVSWSGGVFAAPAVRDGLAAQLAALPDPVQLRAPLLSPVVGAAVHAARLAGRPLDAAAVHRLAAR